MRSSASVLAFSCLFLGLLVCGSAAQAQSYQFAFEFGSEGSGDGEYGRPHNAAIDSQGNIFVPDFDNNRIQKLDSRGRFILQWGMTGSGNGQFNGPVGIAVDGNDDVYVVELRNHRIQKFDNDGNFLLSWGTLGTGNGQFDRPSDLAAAPNGTIYVADRSNHRIQQFDAIGTFLDSIGSQGTANGQFELPTGVFVTNNGVLYVADQGNHRIQIFNSANDFSKVFGSPGAGAGEFDRPSDMALDPDGNLVVVDKDNARIQVMGFDGEFFSQIGGSGSAPGQFNQPRGVTVGPDGLLYVADRDNHRIQVFVKRAEFEVENPLSQAGDNFGQSIAISGQLVAIGAPGRVGGGSVDIFRREGDQLLYEGEIPVPPSQFSFDDLGKSIHMQGDVLVVGAPRSTAVKGTTALQAAIFQRAQTGWQFKAPISSTSQTTGDEFGAAVAISGNMVSVGAPGDNSDAGKVHMFELMPDSSVQPVAELGPMGQDTQGVPAQRFGAALAFKQGKLAAGGPGGIDTPGLVSVFDQVADNLSPPAVIAGSNVTGDGFGSAISLTGDSVLVGAPGEESNAGKAFFFPGGGNFATKIPITPPAPEPDARFGASAAIDLQLAIIGSPGPLPPAKGATNTGLAFSFTVTDSGATAEDTDMPPADTCTAKRRSSKSCGEVVSYGEAAAIGDGISVVGAPRAKSGEGTVFVTIDNLRLFRGGFEGEDSGLE